MNALSAISTATLLLCLVAATLSGEFTITHKVEFSMKIGFDKVGKIVIGLFGDTVPRTVQNFFELANSTNGYGYQNSKIHRVVPGFLIQGGDFLNGDGTGMKSIYGGSFEDESFTLKHYGPGWVSMSNLGKKHTNGCQFFILLTEARALDKYHVVFGKVLENMELVERISQLDVAQSERPKTKVTIYRCDAYEVEPYDIESPVIEVDEEADDTSIEDEDKEEL